MNPAEAMVLLSNAVSLLQGIAAITESYDKVSDIIARRIADKRLDWTMAERQEIMDALNKARADAVAAVDKLP